MVAIPTAPATATGITACRCGRLAWRQRPASSVIAVSATTRTQIPRREYSSFATASSRATSSRFAGQMRQMRVRESANSSHAHWPTVTSTIVTAISARSILPCSRPAGNDRIRYRRPA